MRRIISLILTAVMLIGTLAVVSEAYEPKNESNFRLKQSFKNLDKFTLGDANDDGNTNAIDALEMKKLVSGNEHGEISLDASDFDADGKITARDVFSLKACLANAASIEDYDSDKRVYKAYIGGVDISEFTVEVPENTTYEDNIWLSYELLWKYVEKACGVKLPVSYGVSGKANVIRFHDVVLDSELGEEFGMDGYRYTVSDGCLDIYGTYRGNMYAVYEILEEYFGFFFYSPDHTATTKKRSTDIPEGTEKQYVTPLTFRNINHTFGNSESIVYYSLARGLNSARRRMSGEKYYGYFTGTIHCNAHSFYYYEAMGRGEMPEEGTLNEFGLPMTLTERLWQKFLNGGGDVAADHTTKQPCASNIDSVENIYQGFREVIMMLADRGDEIYFKEGVHYMSYSINDNEDFCTCRLCSVVASGSNRFKFRNSLEAETFKSIYGEDRYEIYKEGNTYYGKINREGYSGVYLNMVNNAARRAAEEYPGIHLFYIVYNSVIPETIVPESNVAVCYCCGIYGCAIHHYGDGDSANCHTVNSDSHDVTVDEEGVVAWVDICNAGGAELWYWYYPNNYSFHLYELPVLYDMYYDLTWLYKVGVKGLYYEGNGPAYFFEDMRAYLASEIMWNPEITLDEYLDCAKKYLEVTYGKGYEHAYNYLMMIEESSEGDDTTCGAFYYRMFDVHSRKYIKAHYEEMRDEVLAALAEASDSSEIRRCRLLLMNCDFLGLSALYDEMYTNGTEDSRKLYKERYDEMYKIMKDEYVIASRDYPGEFQIPASPDYSSSPCMQVYHAENRFPQK